MVINHGTMTFLATLFLIAEPPYPAPTPTILEDSTWIVDTVPCTKDALRMTIAVR